MPTENLIPQALMIDIAQTDEQTLWQFAKFHAETRILRPVYWLCEMLLFTETAWLKMNHETRLLFLARAYKESAHLDGPDLIDAGPELARVIGRYALSHGTTYTDTRNEFYFLTVGLRLSFLQRKRINQINSGQQPHERP